MPRFRLKVCTKCGAKKGLNEFKLQKRKTGHFPTSWCRACLNEKSKLFMREHLKKPGVRERVLEKDRARQKRLSQDSAWVAKENARKSLYLKSAGREKRRAYEKAMLKHPVKGEHRRAWYRAHRASNPEKFAAYGRNSRQSPEGRLRARLASARWRARVKNNSPSTLTREEWLAVLTQHGRHCHYCGRTDRKLTIDHVLPVSRGGADSKDNVVPACKPCNSRKGARSPEELPPGTFPFWETHYGG